MTTAVAARTSKLSNRRSQTSLNLNAEKEKNFHSQQTIIEEETWLQLVKFHSFSHGSDATNKGPFCDSPLFNGIIGVIILVNAVCMGLETDLNRNDSPPSAKLCWSILGHFFTTVWVFEFILRFKTHTWAYFHSNWNVTDAVLACLAILDSWIMPLIGQDGAVGSLVTLKLLRMLRLARLVRIVRKFKELWLLVSGFMHALSVLGWAALLMSIILYVAAIMAVEMIGKDCDTFDDSFSDCSNMFSTVPRAGFTLFQLVTLESWSQAVVRPIMETKPWAVIFFIVFLFITHFALLNIIVGVIVENTLEMSRSNAEMVEKVKEQIRLQELEALRRIFERADHDGTASLSKEEFEHVCSSPDVQEHFEVLELPMRDAEELFFHLDADDSGHISIGEFIAGCLQLKDTSTENNVAMIVLDLKCMKKRLRHQHDDNAKNFQDINDRMGRMETNISDRIDRLESMMHEVCTALGTQANMNGKPMCNGVSGTDNWAPTSWEIPISVADSVSAVPSTGAGISPEKQKKDEAH